MERTAGAGAELDAAAPAAAPAARIERGGAYEEMARRMAARGARFAELWFTDLGGKPWRIAMPASAVTRELFAAGLPLDGQPVGGSWDGVMVLLPRLEASFVVPTAPAASLAMLCDVLDPVSGEPLALEPRHVLARAAARVEASLDAELTVGAEPEFVLLEDGGAAGEGLVWEFLRALALALEGAGVPVDWFRSGPGAGQGRVQMRAAAALATADRVILYRQLAGELARARGLTASFLPLPLAGGGTPGMPVHFAAWRDGENLFHDAGGWSLTSRLCRSFAGGLLAHLPALAALCAPTTNSYRRLVTGVCGPASPLLSAKDRDAACRIPARSPSPSARRVKFCVPDGSSNPYLALAAAALAGLDGVERALDAPTDRARPAGPRLPHSLEAALDGLDSDRDFLTASGAFSDPLIDAWIRDRWTGQVLPVRARPHPWETAAEGRP